MRPVCDDNSPYLGLLLLVTFSALILAGLQQGHSACIKPVLFVYKLKKTTRGNWLD